MAYASIQMFMEKLKQLTSCNYIPFFNNHPDIISQRPQFQLLYDDLASMVQTLFIEKHQDLHEHEKVNDLKKRFTDAAEEAQYIVDMFLSGVLVRNNGDFPTFDDFNSPLCLDDVRNSFKSVQVEFMSMRIDSMKMGTFRRPEKTLDQTQIPITRISSAKMKLVDEIYVGLDRDVELIRDKLVADRPMKVDVVSIVGMGGIGKTTLATKVFNDDYVKHHFHFRVWVTVSPTYDKRDVLVQILGCIRGQLDLEKANDSRLRELVHKNLLGKRYLIVIDDIWHIETWNNVKLFFTDGNNGSRILLTSRIIEVAKHANSDGLIHHMGCLNKEISWELLRQKVFCGSQCPEWSIKPGMQIVENCKGLPLAVLAIAGVLAKDAWSEKFWVEIAEKSASYIVGEGNGCLETLALSYNHLPLHLRECFLYFGGFPENYAFEVQRLICLWVAEGFIQEDGNKSLEDTTEGYLMDLINRNLVTVPHGWRSNGVVIGCKVHYLVRELCLVKAKEERFILQTGRLICSSNIITTPYKPIRMFTSIRGFPYRSVRNLRSILCFSDFISLRDKIEKPFPSFLLLRVLDLQNCTLNDFPKGMELLIHLRFLAIWKVSPGFPSSICNLWNLQTLNYISDHKSIVLPSNISDLVNLRHLWSDCSFSLPFVEKPMICKQSQM